MSSSLTTQLVAGVLYRAALDAQLRGPLRRGLIESTYDMTFEVRGDKGSLSRVRRDERSNPRVGGAMIAHRHPDDGSDDDGETLDDDFDEGDEFEGPLERTSWTEINGSFDQELDDGDGWSEVQDSDDAPTRADLTEFRRRKKHDEWLRKLERKLMHKDPDYIPF